MCIRDRLWFVGGAALVVASLVVVLLAGPGLFGRAGQVSILNTTVSGGEPLLALLGNAGRALGLYLWRGDAILRHNALLSYDAVLKADNPAGRPLFDLFMAGPFLLGLGWCVGHWRRPAAAFLLLWQLVMLGQMCIRDRVGPADGQDPLTQHLHQARRLHAHRGAQRRSATAFNRRRRDVAC